MRSRKGITAILHPIKPKNKAPKATINILKFSEIITILAGLFLNTINKIM